MNEIANVDLINTEVLNGIGFEERGNYEQQSQSDFGREDCGEQDFGCIVSFFIGSKSSSLCNVHGQSVAGVESFISSVS